MANCFGQRCYQDLLMRLGCAWAKIKRKIKVIDQSIFIGYFNTNEIIFE